VSDRFPRRMRFVGGPLDGGDQPLPLPAHKGWPQYICTKSAGTWEHYLNDTNDLYLYESQCAGIIEHPGGLPHEHACCCGRSGCDGREMR
jgi:hypothetical protein